MQALKTVAESACHAAVAPAVDKLQHASAYVCGPNLLYAATPGSLHAFDVVASAAGGPLTIHERQQQFSEPLPVTTALLLLPTHSLLAARGYTKVHDPDGSTVVALWYVRASSTHAEKVRDAPVHQVQNGAVSAWTRHEDESGFTIALAFNDPLCTVQLMAFKKGDQRPSKPSVSAMHINKDAQADLTVTNIRLVVPELDMGAVRLFVTLVSAEGPGRIETWSTDTKHAAGDLTTLEATSVPAGQCCMYGNNQVIIVTAPEHSAPVQSYASQFSTYTADSRVLCLPYQYPVAGELVQIDTHTLALPVRNRRGDLCVSVVDMKNRLELCCHVVANGLKALVPMMHSRSVVIVHDGGATTLLLPKEIATQIANITKRKHYKEAIGVAQDELQRLDAGREAEREALEELIANTEAKFATHLLERAGEPDAAMEHFIQTIGYLPVSTVIQKFLDTTHTELLKRYLEEVVRRPRVMRPAFAAVLISLYVQLRERDALRAFLDANTDEERGYKWAVDEALDTCLNGGYYEEALRVAKLSKRHAKTVDIYLNHAGSASGGQDALTYIRSLPRPEKEALLQRHGKTLISKFQLEMQVTPIVHDLCLPSSDPRDGHVSNLSQFVSLYDDAPGALRMLCDTLLQEWLQGHHGQADGGPGAGVETIFHQLLELLLDPLQNQGQDGLKKEEREKRALEILKRGWPAGAQEGPLYRYELALQLCHFYSFKDGLLFLFERMQDVAAQLRTLVDYKNWARLVSLGLEQPGDRGQHLSMVLHELVDEADREPSGDAPKFISRALTSVSRDASLGELLPPLSVLAILQRSTTLSMSVVAGFLESYVHKQQASAQVNAARVQELRMETERLKSEIHSKKTQPLWIPDPQRHDGQPLGSSAVHFFCGHAYDEDACERRPEDGTFVCSLCQADPNKQHIRRMMQAESVDRSAINEQFFSELRTRSGGSVFDVVGHYLANSNALI